MPVRLPNASTTRLLDLIEAIRQIAEGRGNSSGTVTLTANTTTTVVTHQAIGRDAAILLNPRTLNAAGALATTYVSAQSTGTFTLTHANAATTDREFRWVAAGG